MACDITKILNKLSGILDKSIKGNAKSITQDAKGDFLIHWGPDYKVKTHSQAYRMAEQKVEAAHKVADEAQFRSKIFGPYLAIDSTLTDAVKIVKLEPIKLRRALEMRNEAEAKEDIALSELLEKDRDFFDEKTKELQTLAEQNDNRPEGDPLEDAKYFAKDIKIPIYKEAMERDPKETLKFVAEQYYGISMGIRFPEDARFDVVEIFGSNIIEIAKEMYPLDSLLSPDGLPPIEPEC